MDPTVVDYNELIDKIKRSGPYSDFYGCSSPDMSVVKNIVRMKSAQTAGFFSYRIKFLSFGADKNLIRFPIRDKNIIRLPTSNRLACTY